jgi:hypothetical protein
VDEIAVELRHRLGMLEHDLGDERARLEIPPALELEDVSFGADDGTGGKLVEEGTRAGRAHGRLRSEDGALSHRRGMAARRIPTQNVARATSQSLLASCVGK